MMMGSMVRRILMLNTNTKLKRQEMYQQMMIQMMILSGEMMKMMTGSVMAMTLTS